MEGRGRRKINHLSFAYDIIIFTSTIRSSLKLIKKTIVDYEMVSDQQLTKDKSSSWQLQILRNIL